jgi:hypothetical protein
MIKMAPDLGTAINAAEKINQVVVALAWIY